MKKIMIYLLLFMITFTFNFSISTEEIVNNYDKWLKSNARSLIEGKFIDNKDEVIGSRLMEQWIYNDEGIMKKVIAIYRPASCRGTRFLIIENKNEDDSLWVYMPELKKVRRNSMSEKSKPFLNSLEGTLSNEELEFFNIDDYNYKYLKDDKFYDEDCFVVEFKKKDSSSSQYSKILTWIVKDKWVNIKQEYYDKSNILLKTSKSIGLKKINNNWNYTFYELKNDQNGNTVVFNTKKIALGDEADISEKRFTQRYLQTGKVK